MKITETYTPAEDSDFKKRVAELNEKYQNGEIDIIRLETRHRPIAESTIEYRPVPNYQYLQKMHKNGD